MIVTAIAFIKLLFLYGITACNVYDDEWTMEM